MTIARRHTEITAYVVAHPGATIAAIAAALALPVVQVETAVWTLRDRAVIEADGDGWKRRHSSVRAWRAA